VCSDIKISDKRVTMSLKAKVEAIIYAAEEPITLEQISQLLKDVVLADLAAAKENAAIEQADSAAEAEAANRSEAVESTSEDTALPPDLTLDSAELVCPELGPLMPQAATPEVNAPAEGALPEAVEENDGSEEVLEAGDPAHEVSEQDRIEESGDEDGEQQPAAENLPQEVQIAPAALEGAAEFNSADAERPAASASVSAPEATSRKRQPKKSEQEIAEDKAVRARIREILIDLVTDYSSEERGIEIRQVAGGFRMATKAEHHDVVRAFAKSLKPPIRLSLAALETLAVIAYKQPITGPEIGDIRGVESAGVLGTLLDRKLITTAGRKQVIGRPMQYKTSKDFLMRFGLNDVNELPSMEEFSQLASDGTIEIAPESQTPSLFEPNTELDVEPKTSEANEPGVQLPNAQEIAEPQKPDASETLDSQPQSDAESNNIPEAEHPIGQ
jgi:segregation and condensation protein B